MYYHYLCFLCTQEHQITAIITINHHHIIILIMIILINMAMTLADAGFVLSKEKGAWLCCRLIKRQTSKTKIFFDEEQD